MLQTESYLAQLRRWPKNGRHILAQFNNRGVIVYQAYRPAIGQFAAQHQFFGGEFKLSRMSWVKTNFLWMMHRCGWGLKTDQEVVLAINIRREAFDSILEDAVHSTFVPEVYGSHDEWKQRLNESSVRVQWDPDHDPFGVKQERRAVQLGLAGEVLRSYSQDWILSIEDISSFVAKERENLSKRNLSGLVTPLEEVYPVNNPQVARRLGIAEPECAGSVQKESNGKKDISESKFLSLVLRHKPETIGVSLDSNGWIAVDVLLSSLAKHGRSMSRKDLERLVRESDKQRFALSEDGTRIRASQGHSVEVDLDLSPQTPPEKLYHGTVRGVLMSIMATGLEKRARHHVHLSSDVETAERVGRRRGRPVILEIQAGAMYREGHVFFLSSNGVWLVDHVPPKFIIETKSSLVASPSDSK